MAKSAKEILSAVHANLPKLERAIPEVVEDFGRVLMPDVMKDGALSIKEKELIALGIAVVQNCDYCIVIHVKKCYEAGATREEMAEACSVAILMGGGPAFTYSTFALQAIEELGTK